jgi:site-specific recombinase XerD
VPKHRINPYPLLTLFIITALYLMYLRSSELVANERWIPQMGHFYEDTSQNWWFTIVDKGDKQRHIAVGDDMLKAFQRYWIEFGLSALLSPKDNMPLIPKVKGKGAVSDVMAIRKLVQQCFDSAVAALRYYEARDLGHTTVHWLRHTGISDDINKRGFIAHVRNGAGHSSVAITDRYNNITLQERHASAKRNRMKI